MTNFENLEARTLYSVSERRNTKQQIKDYVSLEGFLPDSDPTLIGGCYLYQNHWSFTHFGSIENDGQEYEVILASVQQDDHFGSGPDNEKNQLYLMPSEAWQDFENEFRQRGGTSLWSDFKAAEMIKDRLGFKKDFMTLEAQ